METRRLFVVAFLCMLAGFSVTLASTLEELFVTQQPGWMLGIPAGTIQEQHLKWHLTDFGASYGREFLEYHRELLAQSDDFRIYGSDTDSSPDPDPVVISILALPGSNVKFEHIGNNCCPRVVDHRIEHGAHPPQNNCTTPPIADCHLDSKWTQRPANLLLAPNPLGSSLCNYNTAEEVGVVITRDFHNQGHGTIGRHQPFDMVPVFSSVKDGAFFQWHKNVDNIYADWAVGQYQHCDKGGLPIFFSVASRSTPPPFGADPSALRDRSGSDAYAGRSGTARVAATQYGAIPRIPSDIYVGDHNGSNLLYAAGTRKSGSASTEAWDVDAFSILNRHKASSDGWYFSVTMTSFGKRGELKAQKDASGKVGGDVFEDAPNKSNYLVRSEASLGLSQDDELDALEVDQQRQVQGTNDSTPPLPGVYDRPKQWFSLRLGSTFGVKAFPIAGGMAVDVDPSDILQFFDAPDNNNDLNPDPDDGHLVIAVSHTELGLNTGGVTQDDLDALVIVDTDGSNTLNATTPGMEDLVYYSLTATSPSLTTRAASAADILCHKMGSVYPNDTCTGAVADDLGLLTTDDLDALDIRRGVAHVAGVYGPAGTSGKSSMAASSILADPLDPGACCHANGTCTEVLSTACVSPGDSFAGFDTVCAAAQCPSAPGACCAANGTCTVVSDQACADQAGIFRGAGTTCPPIPACPVAPGNDECATAFVIPYNFVSPYDPPSDNTNATISPYFQPPALQDPPYSCNDHNVFSGPYGSGTIWYSYTVPTGSGSSPGPGPQMPTPGRSIYLSTQRAAQHYPIGGGAGDTRLAMYFAPNGDCSVLQEVACADNIAGDTSSLAPYAPLRYNNPFPGKYYIQVSTVYNVDRGQTYLRVSDPPVPPVGPTILPLSRWALAVLTLVLMGAGALLLGMRRRVAM